MRRFAIFLLALLLILPTEVYGAMEKTPFSIWLPEAETAEFAIEGGTKQPMTRGADGMWYAEAEGGIKGKTYHFFADGQEVPDPYAKAVTVNGTYAVAADLDATDPPGWESDTRPPLPSPVDAVIYEVHIRDFSTHASSGMVNKGKFLAFTEASGVRHLKELGITHVHLLPAFDFASLDETAQNPGYNWGYDPLNYNVPEGTYATDAADPLARVREFKQMVQALHKEGIGVIMDVVYNHMSGTRLGGQYFRLNADGTLSNGSGCGNEVASEKPMVRQMIADSVAYWAEEYHVDGFRFDLMGLTDTETMNHIRRRLDAIDPQILMYGEGWTAGETVMNDPVMPTLALKENMELLDERIAAFSDNMRDGIKGSVFDALDKGFVAGAYERKEDIKFGVVASVSHPQVEGDFWAKAPTQTVTYDSCHDNLTLWDKLSAASPDAAQEELLAMNRMAAAMVLTSQGIPFLHAGEEIARSKGGDDNSYQSPDSVNQIRWNTKAQYRELFDYYAGLIALRKIAPAFRLRTAEEIREKIEFLDTAPQVVAYTLDKTFVVAFNADSAERTLRLPEKGRWAVFVNGTQASASPLETFTGDRLTLTGRSAFVLAYAGQDEEALRKDFIANIFFGISAVGILMVVWGNRRRKRKNALE